MTSAILLLAPICGAPPAPVTEIKTPPGFTATLYADNPLAPDIYTMTIDDAGRILVAGRGYVRVLVDDDGDGRADRAADLLDGLSGGPMGLLAEGDSLFVVVDGGLKRYRGYNGRDKLKGPPETLLAVKTAGEHDAHAVRRGPDGWLYLLCGNMAGVPRDRIDKDRSPVKDPVAGCLLRLSPDFKTLEVVADGFRNAYDFDFHTSGEPFTYDSDNERCVGLPWYEGCRFYHLVPGGNYGWRSPQLSQTWRKPPYFADVVAPIADLGRGSPTGVACYRHTQFPRSYRGGFFLADWTFGRVHFVPLEAKHSTFAGKPEVFLEATGESGFAPTALAVHPKTGELFVSIGGRGTRGAIYRVRCDGGDANPKPLPVAKRTLDYTAEVAKTWLADATCDDPVKRRVALELMLRWREKIGFGPPLFDVVKPNLAHDDPLIRAVAGRLAVATAMPTRDLKDPQTLLSVSLAAVEHDPDWAYKTALSVLTKTDKDDLRLQSLRIIQLALGDLTAPDAVGTVWEGYTLRRPISVAKRGEMLAALSKLPATKVFATYREINRTLAAVSYGYHEVGLAGPWFLKDSDVLDDIHNLICLARTGSHAHQESEWVADALLRLDRKVEKRQLARDRHWPMRITEVASRHAQNHSNLGERVLLHPDFGRSEHALLVKPLGIGRARAARKFLDEAKQDPDYTWTQGIVALLGSLPGEESRPVLLKLWDRGGLEEAIIPVLAAEPNAADSDKFLVGLKSLDADVVRVSAAALGKLPAADKQADVIAAILALRRLPEDKAATSTRDELTKLLRSRTKQTFGPDAKAWSEWFAKAHPGLAAKLTTSDGFDPVTWKKREVSIPWDRGDAAGGRKVFVKATCAACHDGGGAVGPSLQGVSKRFGRDDLLATILQPSKDVSPRYRPTRITTTEGKAFVGMIVYEATDGVILQTGPDTTVRIAGNAIETKRTLDTSLMPAGLLDKLTDQEIADLLAYLRTQ